MHFHFTYLLIPRDENQLQMSFFLQIFHFSINVKAIFHSAKNSDQKNFSSRTLLLGFLVHFPFGAEIIFRFVRWPVGVTTKPKSYGKTKKSRQNKKATAKQKSRGKTKSHDKAKTTATQNSHSKTKNSRQNKIATTKQKSHGKTKMPRQNEKVMANQKRHGKT